MQRGLLGPKLEAAPGGVDDAGPAREGVGAAERERRGGAPPTLRFALLMTALTVLAFAGWAAVRAACEGPPSGVLEPTTCRAEHCPIDAAAVPSLRATPDAP